MAKQSAQAADPDAPDVSQQPHTKKPAGNVPTNIRLEYDLVNQRVLLPREDFLKNPDFFLMREEAFFKECLVAAFSPCTTPPHNRNPSLTLVFTALASGKTKPVRVAWTKLGENPGAFLPQELIPEDVTFCNPSHMKVAHREVCVRLWLEKGHLYVLRRPLGSEDTLPVPARAVPDAPAQAACIIPGNMVNRYGSCGKEVLEAIGVQLYEAEEDNVTDLVTEDALIDPAELERAENAENNHLSPCVVPLTSEARAQYCMTSLQLVNDGEDKTTAGQAVKSLLLLPVCHRQRQRQRQCVLT